MFFLLFILLSLFSDQTEEKGESSKLELSKKESISLSKWETGLGYFYADLQDYPASNEKTIRSFPIPYFIYRGDIVRADREGGIRTRFLKGAFYEFDFSFSGSFPSDASDNQARKAMNDLDWMFEIGPQLKLFLYTSKASRLQFRLPLRSVFTTDFPDIKHQGYSLSPDFTWSFMRFPFTFNILSLSVSLETATTEIHRYFYDVPAKFVTSDRPAYSSEKGIMGATYGLSLVSRWKTFSFFTGFNYNSYKLAKNKDSPLHKANSTTSIFAGLVYSFYQSKEQGSR